MGHSLSTPIDLEKAVNNVRFHYFYKSDNVLKQTQIIYGDVESITRTTFNAVYPLIVLVHGFNTTFEASFLQETKNALLQQHIQVNIVMMDYRELSRVGLIHFQEVIPYLPGLSQRLTDFLLFLINIGVVRGPENIHLVGESLGAQICGLVGKNIEKLKGCKIKRITGLDPAGPIFQDEPENVRLCASDASFVDVVHSNQGVLGYIGNTGMVDFYLNGGGPIQPKYKNHDAGWIGLDKNDMSHAFATELFSESILKKSYYGCGCYRGKRTCEQYDKNPESCPTNVLFGYYAPSSIRGEFYIRAYDDDKKILK